MTSSSFRNLQSINDSPSILGQRSGQARSLSAVSTKHDTNVWVVAVIDSRGPSGEVGIAAISSLTFECVVVELCDTSRFTRCLRFLNIYSPAMLLCCDTPNSARLSQALRDAGLECPIEKCPRQWFNDLAGKEAVENMCMLKTRESLLVTLDKRYYALSAFSALSNWIKEGGDKLHPNSFNIKYTAGDEGVMIIDYHTSKYLEIIRPLQTNGALDGKNTSSLLATVNQCKTMMGTRLLRSNLLQPSLGT